MSTNARKAAYDALSAITKDGAYTSLALKKHIPGHLSNEDKAFATRIVRTTLENLLRIDYALAQFITAKRVHGSVKNVLRLGACQLLYMNVESYAAVSESVRLVKKIKPQMSGFVNAVLRALEKGREGIVYPNGKNAKDLSIRSSHPEWICEKFIRDFGYEFAEALLTHRPEKGTAVRLNTLRANREILDQETANLGLSYRETDIQNAFIIEGLSGIEKLDMYKSGFITVQSLSAMRAVNETSIEKNSKVLDCCAAPGGKSAYAAALAKGTLDIVAWDVHAHRVNMTNENYARLGVQNAKAVLHDAAEYQACLASAFDTVLVDAPCSAMGLMARNPDVRYHRKPEDIPSLQKKQAAILQTCARYVRSGGTLAYYTCSVNKEENEDITNAFLAQTSGFEYAQPPKTLVPHIDGSDGFFIAVMKRL